MRLVFLYSRRLFTSYDIKIYPVSLKRWSRVEKSRQRLLGNLPREPETLEQDREIKTKIAEKSIP